jgi:Domain of unknown function (DUF4926)
MGLLTEIGVVAPRIVTKVIRARNYLEHQYRKPEKGQVEDAVDVATLFVAALERSLAIFPESFSLDNLVEGFERDGMANRIKLLDVVALTVDLPEVNLWRGQVGTVVDLLAGGTAFEVEFSDRNGRAYASLGLRPDQMMVLRYEPVTTQSLSGGTRE